MKDTNKSNTKIQIHSLIVVFKDLKHLLNRNTIKIVYSFLWGALIIWTIKSGFPGKDREFTINDCIWRITRILSKNTLWLSRIPERPYFTILHSLKRYIPKLSRSHPHTLTATRIYCKMARSSVLLCYVIKSLINVNVCKVFINDSLTYLIKQTSTDFIVRIPTTIS